MTAAGNYSYRILEFIDFFSLFTLALIFYESSLKSRGDIFANFGAAHVTITSLLLAIIFIFPNYSNERRYYKLSQLIERQIIGPDNTKDLYNGAAYYFVAHELNNWSSKYTVLPIEYKKINPVLWMGNLDTFFKKSDTCIIQKELDFFIIGPGKAGYKLTDIENTFGKAQSIECLDGKCKWKIAKFNPPANISNLINNRKSNSPNFNKSKISRKYSSLKELSEKAYDKKLCKI